MLDIIAAKRDGKQLTDPDIRFVVENMADIHDYQLAAWLMAVTIRGMNAEETASLALHMARSGDRLDLSPIIGVPVDKHSTGGVADTTTLICAPLAAACGAPVVKMSGRSLGHTGGTLDKLWSIPGMRTEMPYERLVAQVNEIGVALVGQSERLCPADKRLYSLRDVTGTVGSLPLIAASIMSKKIASGCGALVLDVKCGSGALLPDVEQAHELSRRMVDIGRVAGISTVALVTDMSQPLGSHIGNALEVREAIGVLSGRETGPLADVSVLLAAHMAALSLGVGLEEAKARTREALANGAGLTKLRDMIAAQGGDSRVVNDPLLLPRASHVQSFPSPADGYIATYDTPALGRAAQALGAGRERMEDIIDPAVGVVVKRRIGDRVERGQPLFELHAAQNGGIDAALALLKNAFTLSNTSLTPPPLVREVYAANG